MGGGGKGKKKKQTVGYRYFMAAIFGLSLRATRLLSIVYGERVAWQGSAAPGSSISVNSPGLYGGDDVGGSGGLQGTFYFNGGSADQQPDAVMKNYLGQDCPAHRGLATLSMGKSYVSAYSASFRPLYCKVQNLGYGWQSSYETIAGTQINPAHEIRDALINPELGGQFTAADLDEDSFAAAARTLYSENFGLSPKWTDTGKALDYVNDLLEHVDGTLVRDRKTGKMKLKLYRGGYDVSSLPVIGPDRYSSITSMGTVAASSMINKLTIKYVRLTNIGEETATLTAENLANIAMQGGMVNASEKEFPFLTDAIADLPGRILARELHAQSFPLRSFTLTGTYALESLEGGDLFVLNAPDSGIENMVCRVLEADYGTMTDHRVTLTCSEDIYGTEISSFVVPPSTEWQNPFTRPTCPNVSVIMEMPLYAALALSPLSTLEEWTKSYPYAGFVLSLARKNAATDLNYTHMAYDGAWKSEGKGEFADSALLTSPVGRKDTSFPVPDTSLLSLAKGDLAFIGGEFVRIDSWSAHAVTVTRGVLDTLPIAHEAGARLWIPGDNGGVCERQYSSGQQAGMALVTMNSAGEAAYSTSDRLFLTMQARCFRPYPPAGLAINGAYLAGEISGPLSLSWKHRDRLDLAESIVSQSDGHVGPEEGTTYSLNIYDENGVKRKSITGLTGSSWSWDTEEADCGLQAVDMVWASTDVTNTAAESFSVALGSGIAAGDMLLAHVMHRDAVTGPEGWTLLTATDAGGANQQLSVFYKTADGTDAGATVTWTPAAKARINVSVSAWRHPSGLKIARYATVMDQDTNYGNITLPQLASEAGGQVVFAVSNVFALTSGNTTYSTTAGVFFSPSSAFDLRLVCGTAYLPAGAVLDGKVSTTNMTGSYEKSVMASAALLVPADGSALSPALNRTVRIELWSVRDGYDSWQKWNHTVSRRFGDEVMANTGGESQVYAKVSGTERMVLKR